MAVCAAPANDKRIGVFIAYNLLFGDETGLYTGATEFRVTDIDIPGTGLVPMRRS